MREHKISFNVCNLKNFKKSSSMEGSIMKIRIGLCMMVFTMLNFFVVPSLFATPLVDGRFDASEGYTTGYRVDFEVEGGRHDPDVSIGGGELWVTQDAGSGDLFLAFIQPLSLVDNRYGDNAIGWGSNAPSGKNITLKIWQTVTKRSFHLLMGIIIKFSISF